MNRQEEIKKIVEQVIRGYKPEKIMLFGSCANGRIKSSSDIDLAIIKSTKKTFAQRLKEIAGIVKTWEPLDVLIYTPKEWQRGIEEGNYFIEEIAKTGKMIYEKK